MSGPLDAFRLDDRVVVITGASSGLGLGFARAVAAVGGTLVLGARRLDRLHEIADELRATGASVIVRAVDVTVPEQCQALADAATAEYGRVDVLVNNAGLGGSVPALRETPDAFRQVIDVNLHGAFWTAQACARVMPPGSSIVNVASVHGVVASRFPGAAYAASKAGVIGLTRDLAQQWSRRRGIRVNALCPGYFASEMTATGEENLRAMVAEHSLLGRFGEQAEVDGALLFLAGRASSYVTGTTLLVDGGLAATI
ncbi:SDR family NAD(P)-dependent oxidoreductase [Dactylosporangium sp. CA-052675]|uniref:SDR family NAD(P)-dependent oxidoreductase n=1 Tax=Dactylosporangium sp. CA-052675 TaxID=3239927 RepID=UPI003D8B756C